MPPYPARGRLLKSGMTENAVYGQTLNSEMMDCWVKKFLFAFKPNIPEFHYSNIPFLVPVIPTFQVRPGVPLFQCSILPCLDGFLASFSRSDPDHFLDRRNKDFPIPDLSRFGGSFDGLYDWIDHFIGNDDFNFRFG